MRGVRTGEVIFTWTWTIIKAVKGCEVAVFAIKPGYKPKPGTSHAAAGYNFIAARLKWIPGGSSDFQGSGDLSLGMDKVALRIMKRGNLYQR